MDIGSPLKILSGVNNGHLIRFTQFAGGSKAREIGADNDDVRLGFIEYQKRFPEQVTWMAV